MCMIDAECVASVISMRTNNLQATYFHLHPPSQAFLRQNVHTQIGTDPPLGFSPEEAESLYLEQLRTELRAASAAECVWDVEVRLPPDPDAAYYCLMEAIADRFPTVVPPSHVWGFGRQLWNRASRFHGRHPLCVLLLGPAAVGKTSVATEIAGRFGLLHINAGDLLFDEVGISTWCCPHNMFSVL